MSGWLVGRVTIDDGIPMSQFNEIGDWAESLGEDKSRLQLCAAVVHDGEKYRLHLARLAHDEKGRPYLNAAKNEPVWESVAITVEPNSWPQWLTGMGCRISAEAAALSAAG